VCAEQRLGAKFPGPTRRRRGDPSPYADFSDLKRRDFAVEMAHSGMIDKAWLWSALGQGSEFHPPNECALILT